MLSFLDETRVFVVAGVTDMRLSFNGLSAIVENVLEKDPLCGHVFAFCNRRRNRIKLLYWDGSGYWVSAKRLERGTFAWPSSSAKAVSMSREELAFLVSGIEIIEARQRAWYRRGTQRQVTR